MLYMKGAFYIQWNPTMELNDTSLFLKYDLSNKQI